jgi:hypothetical protein
VKGFIGNVLDCVEVCLFCTVGIISRSGYWRTGGNVKFFTRIFRKETVCNKFDIYGYLGSKCAYKRLMILCALILTCSTAEPAQLLLPRQ